MKSSSIAVSATELIEALPDPILVTNGNGEVLGANARAGCLFGCPVDELPGKQIADLILRAPSEGRGSINDSVPVPGVLTRSNGETVPVLTISNPVQRGGATVTVIRPVRGNEHAAPDGDARVLETISEGVMIVSGHGAITYINQAGRAMLGCSSETLPATDVRSIFIPPGFMNSDQGPEQASLSDALTGIVPASDQAALLQCPSATSLEVSVNAMPLDTSSELPTGAIITFQNVTRQKHAELQISVQKHVLDMIASGNTLDETATMIIEYLERVVPGTHGAIYQIERGSQRISLVAAHDVPKPILDALTDTAEDPVSRLCVNAVISRRPLILTGSEADETHTDLHDLLTGTGVQSVWSYPVDSSAHRSMGVITLYRDHPGVPGPEAQSLIDTAAGLLRVALDRVQIERELRYQSFNDDLTGLPNRVLLMDRLDISLQRAAQSDDRVALLLLDVDKFQMVNSSLGHHAGDELLREAARRLRDCVRSDDLVARFTGDTFGILLGQISSESDAINVVMRIQRAFATPLKVTDVDIYASISIGIAVATDRELNADTLVRYSDIALDRAKEGGRGQFAIFSPAQDLSRVPKIELQSRLHRALAADALELHFQPVMSLARGQVAGYEALVRWRDEQFGMVSPDEFLPLAQQSGIMSEITSWVLDRAISQLCRWEAELGTGLFAAVNISPSEMNDSLLVEQVDAVLSRYKVNPACLMLEMTEHALLDTSGQSRQILERLRNLGVRIALDDFGTGYSSLSYLEQLAVDVIKIDRAFVQAARGGATRAPVATAMVDLARKLGMLSVAEGIETEEDERVARQLGCDYSQGYLYGRPQPGTRVFPT